jgi:hypothetical protein
MENVVAIKVRDAKRGWVGLMTWGRLWDTLDDKVLLEAVKSALSGFGIREPHEIYVCNSLREIQSGEYFYEAVINFSWKRPDFGDGFEAWQNERRENLMHGREIYCVGSLEQ